MKSAEIGLCPGDRGKCLALFLGRMAKICADQEKEVVKKITAFALKTVLPAGLGGSRGQKITSLAKEG
jgi:hypothetical protein